MGEYPLWDLFHTCGSVEVWQEGLYVHFRGVLEENRCGFWYLHHCCGECVRRLGLFCPEGGSLVAKGKISLRQFGHWQSGAFTVRNVPFMPLQEPLDGGSLPENAALVQKNGRRFVLIARKDRLPKGIMPYFCFLAPGEICGISCLGFEIDGERKPVFSDIMQE